MNKKFFLATLLASASLTPTFALADGEANAFDVSAFIPVFQSKESRMPGKPYSATETTRVVRTLADGNEIATESVQRLYRDSAGSLRKETLNSSGAIEKIEITAADGVVYVLDPLRKTMRKPAVVQIGMEKTAQGVRVKASGDSAAQEYIDSMNAAQPNPSQALSGFTSQDLGVRELEGCKAEGSASRFDVAAGAQGNVNPMETTTESWFCRDWGMTVLMKHSDALHGQRTTALSQVSFREQDAALFVVPADYTLVALPGQASK